MISKAAAARQLAYDRAVAELHKIDPKAIPIAKPNEVYAIARVAQQVRDTASPEPLAPSSEARLLSRANAMQGSCAALANTARGLGIKVSLPKIETTDPLAALQTLNAFYDWLEKRVEYYRSTTPQDRKIDELASRVGLLEKRMDAMANAMAAINQLLPHLMPKGDK
jgi:hypothetical protein